MTIINLTPHSINVVNDNHETITTFESEGIARVSCKSEVQGYFKSNQSNLGGIPITRKIFGEVEGLPEEKPGVRYIVSSLVASAVPDRHDLLVPDGYVRDEKGMVIGCTALALGNA